MSRIDLQALLAYIPDGMTVPAVVQWTRYLGGIHPDRPGVSGDCHGFIEILDAMQQGFTETDRGWVRKEPRSATRGPLMSNDAARLMLDHATVCDEAFHLLMCMGDHPRNVDGSAERLRTLCHLGLAHRLSHRAVYQLGEMMYHPFEVPAR